MIIEFRYIQAYLCNYLIEDLPSENRPSGIPLKGRHWNKAFWRAGVAPPVGGMQTLAAMCSHVPNKGEQMARYYGYYSNVARGKRKKTDTDDKIPCILEPEQYGGKGTRYGRRYGGRNVLYTAMIVDFWKAEKLSNGGSNLYWNLDDRGFWLWHVCES